MAIVKVDRIASGQHTTLTASDTIVTGLGVTLTGAQVCFNGAPDETNKFLQADIGDQAGTPAKGSFLIKSYKDTDADAAITAATGFGRVVNWIAYA